jgi:hypothetical protein
MSQYDWSKKGDIPVFAIFIWHWVGIESEVNLLEMRGRVLMAKIPALTAPFYYCTINLFSDLNNAEMWKHIVPDKR